MQLNRQLLFFFVQIEFLQLPVLESLHSFFFNISLRMCLLQEDHNFDNAFQMQKHQKQLYKNIQISL